MEQENKNNSCDCNCNFFPKCPECEKGSLLPFSFKEDVFEKWKCSNPKCGFTVKKREDR